MGEFPSGQRGQTVNLLSLTSLVRIQLPPPYNKKRPSRSFFCYIAKMLHFRTRCERTFAITHISLGCEHAGPHSEPRRVKLACKRRAMEYSRSARIPGFPSFAVISQKRYKSLAVVFLLYREDAPLSDQVRAHFCNNPHFSWVRARWSAFRATACQACL